MYVPLTLLPNNFQRICYELTRMADAQGMVRPVNGSVAITLAMRCDISLRAVRRYLRILRCKGWLSSINEQVRVTGMNGAVGYQLIRKAGQLPDLCGEWLH